MRYFEPLPPQMEHEIVDVHPKLSVAAFYERLQFTGTAEPHVWMPRIRIRGYWTSDLEKCKAT